MPDDDLVSWLRDAAKGLHVPRLTEAADEIKRLRAIEAKLIATADDDAGGILGEYAAKVLGERVMRLLGREVEE